MADDLAGIGRRAAGHEPTNGVADAGREEHLRIGIAERRLLAAGFAALPERLAQLLDGPRLRDVFPPRMRTGAGM